jgi:hypothetical protein
MICKFRRAIVIEAIRFEDTKESFDEIRAWVGDNFYYDYQNAPRVFLKDADGRGMPINENDWVVKEENIFLVRSDTDMSYFTKMSHDEKAIFKRYE